MEGRVGDYRLLPSRPNQAGPKCQGIGLTVRVSKTQSVFIAAASEPRSTVMNLSGGAMTGASSEILVQRADRRLFLFAGFRAA